MPHPTRTPELEAARQGVPTRLLCQSCGEQGPGTVGGPLTAASFAKPAWCRCPKEKLGGPIVMAPGHVVHFVFETAEQRAWSDKCGEASNAFIRAKDALSERFVRCGKGWRELPRGNAKRERLERAYTNALRALRKLQRQCPHPRASIFEPCACGVCNALVFADRGAA